MFLLLVAALASARAACCLGEPAHLNLTAEQDPTLGLGPLSSSARRMLVRRDANACSGIRCPGGSSCRLLGRVPVCKCPPPFTRLLGTSSGTYVCAQRPIPNAAYLDPQSEARAAVGSPPLLWNSTLAALAQNWANTLRAQYGCVGFIEPNRAGYGQNIAVQFYLRPTNTLEAVSRWVRQGINYTLAIVSTPSASGCKTGNWQDCSTYLQTVWQYTGQVGCGFAQCPRGDQVWVCNYYVPGVVNGYYPYSPCYKTTCRRGYTCDPNTGVPPKCRVSPCKAARCPKGATCSVSIDNVPLCSCAKGSAAARQQCVPVFAPQDPVPQTEVVLYKAPNFAGTPWIVRAPLPTPEDPGCVNIPASLTGPGVGSASIVWNVGDSGRSGGTPVACRRMIFSVEADCQGKGLQYTPIPGERTTQQAEAEPFIELAKSFSCVP